MNNTYVNELPPCDLCDADAHFYALTTMSYWANLCDLCFGEFGVGLEAGLGQILRVRDWAATVDKYGFCHECGREYDDISHCPCPSDDCPSHEGAIEVMPQYNWYELNIIASDVAESAIERAMNW